MADLKPCPFCGSEATILERDVPVAWGDKTFNMYISCTLVDCGMRSVEMATELYGGGRGVYSIREKSIEYLTKRWNRRV